MSANIIFSIFLYLFSYLINNYNARDLTITRSSTCTLLVVLTVIVILLTAQVIKLELLDLLYLANLIFPPKSYLFSFLSLGRQSFFNKLFSLSPESLISFEF